MDQRFTQTFFGAQISMAFIKLLKRMQGIKFAHALAASF
jgi:hypothetical protein